MKNFDVIILLSGYEVLGIFGHYEPFKRTRKYKIKITPENNSKTTTIWDFPWKGAWVDVQTEDIKQNAIIHGEMYTRDYD
jgi:hypothetical protein